MSASNVPSPKGRVLEILRMSTEDGPGLRTTVFLKGCTLACAWCHNPESIRFTPEIQWIGSRCIGCKTCLETCPRDALDTGPEGIAIDRKRCDGCGLCVEECPSTALELLGREWTAADLADEVAKDRAYFEKSGGGVTVSGGEATLQDGFVVAFLEELRRRRISTALDTCGQCRWETLEKLLPLSDLILFDVKEIYAERHKKFTGHSNEKILANLEHLVDYLRSHHPAPKLWVRTPLIPGATATEENLTGIGGHLAQHVGKWLERWELCAFNNLCIDKYKRLGQTWEFESTPLLTAEELEELEAIARNSGVEPSHVQATGAARLEDDPDDEKKPSPLRLVKGYDAC